MEDYVGDRFEMFSARSDRINVVDKLLGEIIPVSIIEGALLQVLHAGAHEIREEDLREARPINHVGFMGGWLLAV